MKMRWMSIFFAILVVSLSACDQSKSLEEYIQSGQTHFDNKKWSSAIIEFKNAVKQDPKNASARAKLGKAYLKTYSTNAAIKELRRAIALGYDKTELLLPLGMAYRQSNDFIKIIEEINVEASQSANEQAQVLAMRAIAFLSINNAKDALPALNEAKQLNEELTEVRLAWAIFEGQRGNTPDQKAWLAPLLEREGGIADAWSQMGQIESSQNNLEAAEKAYSRSIDLRQIVHLDYAKRAFVRVTGKNLEGAQSDIDVLKKAGANWPIVGHIDGVIALQQNKTQDAKTKFQGVLSRASQFEPSEYMLALIYFNEKRYQSAATLLENHAAANPTQLRSNLIYAGSLLELNQVGKAMVVLNQLKAAHPQDDRILTLLGDGYMRQRQPDKAIETLKKAAELKPEKAVTRFQLGATLLSNESTMAQGQQELIAAIELDPKLRKAELILFRSYLGEKRFAEALELATKLEKKNPDDSQGANLVAFAHLAEDNKDKALTKLNDTLIQFPYDIPTTHNLARIYLQDNDLVTAKKLYEALLEKEPSNLQTLNQLALIAAREKDKDQMMLRLTQAQERNPDEISSRIALASQYLRQNESRKAVAVLNEAKVDQKQMPGYILLMSQGKLALGEHQHAERLLEGLIVSNPGIPAAHFLLARSYSADNKPEKMRSSLNKTIELEPSHFQALVIMARLDLFEGKIDTFRKRVALLDENFPENQQVQFFKAKIASGDSNFGGAIDTLSSLMEKTPNTEIIIDLSRNQWQSGDKQAAISGLQLWVEVNNDDSQAFMLLAQFYMAENRFEEAKEAYVTLNTLAGDNPVVLNNLAWLLGDSNPEEGIKYAQKALMLSPDNAFTEDTLAMLYLKTKEYDKALVYSAKAAAALTNSAEVQLNYASILVANNQGDKAKELLNTLLTKASNEKTKQLIREQLDQL
jgi:putative PEP-CTERM system TPR-repeat lipoprotein